uniref:WW domain-containing protein n=1 Tax=viral metagenome TaxID=1070528 RepID=A0A6C0EWZ8_9ZZZZ
MSTTGIQWMWENDGGNGYNDFDEDLNSLLELIYSNCSGGKSKNFVIPYKDFKWKFDFSKMTQLNEVSDLERKIIRVENDMVWIFYQHNNKLDFTIINPQDYPIFEPPDPDGWNAHFTKQAGLTTNREYKYDKNGIMFTCDMKGLKGKTNNVSCSNGYTIEKVTLNTLQSLAATRKAAAAVAPQHQHQPQPQAAAVAPQQQLPLPIGWIEQRSPEGIPFYVHTPTAHTTWERPLPLPPGPPPPISESPLPLGWIRKWNDAGNVYYFNTSSNQSQLQIPKVGGKIGKKKKRIIKRQKTYKNKRYTRRKTIKR